MSDQHAGGDSCLCVQTIHVMGPLYAAPDVRLVGREGRGGVSESGRGVLGTGGVVVAYYEQECARNTFEDFSSIIK